MAWVINGRALGRPVTGVERYTRSLLPLFMAQQPDTRVVVPQYSTVVDAPGVPLERFGRGQGHVWEQWVLPKALRPGDRLFSPANTGPWSVRDQVLVVHDLAVFTEPGWFRPAFARWYRSLLPRLAARCRHIVVPSRSTAEAVHERLHVPFDGISIVPPCITPLPATDTPPRHRPYLLLVGAYDPRKQSAKVVELFLRDPQPDLDLVLVGRRSRSLANVHLPRHPRVVELGAVDDATLGTLYRHATALVHASPLEGFALPVLEAMATGCPVMACDNAVLREHGTGATLLFDTRDAEGWQRTLEQLRDPKVRQRYGDAGRQVAAGYSAAHSSAALRAVLELNGTP